MSLSQSQVRADQSDQYRNAIDSIIGSLNKNQELKGNDRFKISIQNFIRNAEKFGGQKLFCISHVCEEYNIQKRRLYDVINVLESVGCIKKTTVDAFHWAGFGNIPHTINKLLESFGFPNTSLLYSKLFSYNQHISIATLTQYFIICFFIFHRPSLDIKQVALFLSKENGRYKTTLCKLYQVTHILESAGIIEKSVIPGELSIVPTILQPQTSNQYFIPAPQVNIQISPPQSPILPNYTQNQPSILSIKSLLNS